MDEVVTESLIHNFIVALKSKEAKMGLDATGNGAVQQPFSLTWNIVNCADVRHTQLLQHMNRGSVGWADDCKHI